MFNKKELKAIAQSIYDSDLGYFLENLREEGFNEKEADAVIEKIVKLAKDEGENDADA